jgi:transcriptional regulator with XRE-family HTH domain
MVFDRPGFDREVGLLLQLTRKRREITQAELAKKIGLPRASYANLESGRQRIPVDILWRAAVVLNVSISSLVPEPTNRGPSRESIFPTPEALFGKSPTATSAPAMTSVMYGTSTSFPMVHDPALAAWSIETAMIPGQITEKDRS